MLEKAHIAFQRVTACGFYEWGAKAAKFGDLSDICQQLQTWSAGVDLSLTKLVSPEPGSDDLPIYLIDVVQIGKHWLVACWNEVPNDGSAISSISMNSKVGQSPKLHTNPVTPNTIPGFASYFYCVPEQNALAAITFDGNAARTKSMVSYVRRFLEQESRYGIRDASSPDQRVVGYTNMGDGVPLNVRPRFTLETYKKPGRRKFLVDNSSRVVKVIRRGHVTLSKSPDKDLFSSFIQFVRGDKSRADVVTGVRTVELSLAYTPTKAEIQKMIREQDEDDDGMRWEKFGFEVHGEPAPIWLERSLASGSVDLDVERSDMVVTVQSLAESLRKQRSTVLHFLDNV